MSKVLLVSMPFAPVKLPSTGLSALKSSCIAHGLSCDLAYLSARFRSYADSPGDYDLLHNYWLTGDWVFGEELFGSHWAAQERGGIDHLVSVLSRENDFHEGEDIRDCLLRLRRLAGPFLEDCLEAIPWQEYDVIGFTSVLDQQTASLALARRIKENWPDKVVALGGRERIPRPSGRGLEEDLRCLVEQRFLIKDGDLYLALVNDLETMAREGHSVVARVLCG